MALFFIATPNVMPNFLNPLQNGNIVVPFSFTNLLPIPVRLAFPQKNWPYLNLILGQSWTKRSPVTERRKRKRRKKRRNNDLSVKNGGHFIMAGGNSELEKATVVFPECTSRFLPNAPRHLYLKYRQA